MKISIKKFPKLYGIASTGKIKSWEISVTSLEDDKAGIITKHGYEGMKMQESIKEIAVGKNIGKSNETTPFEQACSEAQSSWLKKIDSKYTETMPAEGSKNAGLELPMLAHEYLKRGHDIVFPCWAQPKLNGIRNIAKHMGNDSIRNSSRGGKIFNTLNHISESILRSGMLEVGHMFDGEIFHPDLTFQEICAAVKREKEVNPNTAKLEYHVYDYPNEDMPFDERTEMIVASIPHEHKHIKIVETRWINDEKELMTYHKENMERGYEGTMIRNSKGGYKFKHRSTDLQKYKDFMDQEFEIIGGKEGTGKAKGQCIFRCITEDGKEFDVRCVGSNEVREEQYQNLDFYISKALSVKFQAWSDDGIPIFPVGLGIRDYE
jgi:DNA ligase-1